MICSNLLQQDAHLYHNCNSMTQNLFIFLFDLIHNYKIFKSMKGSHIVQEKTHWMKFSTKTFEASDNILSNTIDQGGYGYRNVHYTQQNQQNKKFLGLAKDEVFFDPEWSVKSQTNLKDLDPNQPQQIVIRRLGHLYAKNNQLRPKFFPEFNDPMKKVKDPSAVPHCIHQIGLFDINHYKSLFFTQDFQQSGLYHMVVNYDGRWQTDVVDDFIPVYQHSGQPVWGLDLQQPWMIILIKFWAKRLAVKAKQFKWNVKRGGYHGIKTSEPFEFVNCFSNSNWKLYNLSKDPARFLIRNVNKVPMGHFILKSKNAQFVKQSGLIPNEACYELVSLVQNQNQGGKTGSSQVEGSKQTSKSTLQKRNYIATIRCINKHHWTGKMSVVDPQFKNSYVGSKKQETKPFGMDKTFSIDGQNLTNLFSLCYVTSRREDTGASYSNFYKLEIPANQKNAIYLEFNMPSEGFLDFSVKQSEANKIKAGQKSRVQMQNQNKQQGNKEGNVDRFLKVKYILVKDNKDSAENKQQKEMEKIYDPFRFYTYEIQYLKGYNSGDAHFLDMVKGRYVLRIKSQNQPKKAYYVINYTCSHDVRMKEVTLSKEETSRLLKDAMASNIDRVKNVSLDKKLCHQTIAYGNTFEDIGYGFIGIQSKKSCPYKLLIDVDPNTLKNEGYELKNNFKKLTEPFAVVVNPGQSTAIVLKKLSGDKKSFIWPPAGIAIFQKR